MGHKVLHPPPKSINAQENSRQNSNIESQIRHLTNGMVSMRANKVEKVDEIGAGLRQGVSDIEDRETDVAEMQVVPR